MSSELALPCVDASHAASHAASLASAEHTASAAAAIAAAARSEAPGAAAAKEPGICETTAPATKRLLADVYDEMMEQHKPTHALQTETYNEIVAAMRRFENGVTLREVPRDDLRVINEDASSSFKNGDAVLKRGTPTWHLANWLRREHGILCSIVRRDETEGALLTKRTVFRYRLVATWTQWADARAAGSTAANAVRERDRQRAEIERLERRVRELETEKAALEAALRDAERIARLTEQRSVAPTPVVEDDSELPHH